VSPVRQVSSDTVTFAVPTPSSYADVRERWSRETEAAPAKLGVSRALGSQAHEDAFASVAAGDLRTED